MIEALFAASVALGAWSMFQPSAGTFTITQDGSTIVRMDTRNGNMERCTIVGNALSCRAVVAGEAQTTAAK